jgi:hypothetical protein
MTSQTKLIVCLALLTFIMLVLVLTKQAQRRRSVRKTASDKLRVAEMNRIAWQREHAYALTTDITFQQLLGVEITALMNWLSAHEDQDEQTLAPKRQRLEELLPLFSPEMKK